MSESNLVGLCHSAAAGDRAAIDRLLRVHRSRPRRVIAARMARGLEGRFDASDVVQDALTDAYRRFDEYARGGPCEFFAWLQQLGFDRLNDYYRRHVGAAVRSVCREEAAPPAYATDSAEFPMLRVADPRPEPAEELARKQSLRQLQRGLELLRESDRELIEARFTRRTPIPQIAAVLGISVVATKSRICRALRILAKLVDPASGPGHRDKESFVSES